MLIKQLLILGFGDFEISFSLKAQQITKSQNL